MPSGVAGNIISRRRKRKVAVACDFCRRRKLGCDNAQPKCNKCVQHGKNCVYTERQHKERPSNLRISQLEQENARLREKAVPDRDAQTEPRIDSVRSTSTPENASGVVYGSVSSPTAFATGLDAAKVAAADCKSRLFGETARQRQLELINSRQGRMAFGDNDYELETQLLSAFWNRQYSSGSVVYRTAFVRDMTCAGPYFTSLLLNAILFVATKDLPSMLGQCQATDSRSSKLSFRLMVETELYDRDRKLICESRVTTIQALLLMSDALYSWCDEKSLAWHYLGLAINMTFDLGLHTLRSSFYKGGSVEDHEVGRRVFWAAYVRDKQQSIYQGRPSRLRHSDSNVPIAFLDDYDELQPFDTFTYSTTPLQLNTSTRSVSSFEQLCRLSVIARSVLTTLYSEQSYTKDANALLRSSGALQAELDHWQSSLPAHLTLQPGRVEGFDVLPHTLSLLSMYNVLVILLHRPFVSDGHLRSIVGSSATAAFALCSQAADGTDAILHIYGQHFCFKSCPYFLSYATYVSGTIHVRVAAQNPTGSKAHLALWNCLQILEEQQAICHAPRQSMNILLGLVKRLNVDPGRSYNVQVSRSEAPEGAKQDAAPLGSLVSAKSGPDSSNANGLPVGWDFVSTDIDIDAVIRSFNLAPPSEVNILAPAIAQRGYENLVPLTSEPSVSYHGTWPRSGTEDSHLEHPPSVDVDDLFDPVFGIDALLTDTAWMST